MYYLLFSSNNLDYNKCLFSVSLAGLGQDWGSFLGGWVVKYPLANSRETGDMGLIPGSGRFPGGGNGNHSNFFFHSNIFAWGIPWTEEGVWHTIVNGVTKSQTELVTEHTCCVCVCVCVFTNKTLLSLYFLGWEEVHTFICSQVLSYVFWNSL